MNDEPMNDEAPKVEQDADLKAVLIAKADAAGVKIDKRWSAARIEQALADASMDDPQPAPVVEAAPAAPAPDVVSALMAQIEELKKLVVAQPAAAPAAFTPAAVPVKPITQPSSGTVQCRVTKAGDGKIHTGMEDPVYFKWGDVIHLPQSIAEQLESKQFVEIGAPN